MDKSADRLVKMSQETSANEGPTEPEGAELPNDLEPNKLRRLLLLIVYAFIYQITEVVWFAVSVFQAIHMLVTGRRNETLNDFSVQLTDYMYRVVQYVCMRCETRPWPLEESSLESE